jgi:hypothetical protein
MAIISFKSAIALLVVTLSLIALASANKPVTQNQHKMLQLKKVKQLDSQVQQARHLAHAEGKSWLFGKRSMDFCTYVRNNLDHVNANTLYTYQRTCSNSHMFKDDSIIQPKPEIRARSKLFFFII